MAIDSIRAYRPLWFCFRVLAPTFFGPKSRPAYVYMVMLHLLVTVMFPVHLLLGLLLPSTPARFFQNLTMSIVCVACSLKHLVQLSHLPKMKEIVKLLGQLDDCVQNPEEKRYYKGTLQRTVNLLTRSIYIFFVSYYAVFLPSAILVLWAKPQKLIFLAWLPFDWQTSGFNYGIAYIYQIFSIFTKCLQALTNDVFTPLTLCYLSGHLHMFGMRMSRLGHNQLPSTMNQEFQACCEDYKLLMRLYQLTRETINNVQLVQLTFSGANLCIIICYVLFYVRDLIPLMYNVILFAVVCVQLFPSCYFASVLDSEVERLPHTIYSGNWYEQSAQHRRNILIFSQLSLRLQKRPMMAGDLFKLNLNTFLETLKMAYSLFAVVLRLNGN